MLHHIDIHNFWECRKKFDDRRQKDIKEETEVDRNLIVHIGKVSAIICFIIQLIAVIIGTVFYKQSEQVVLSVFLLIVFQVYKYVLGGFGGIGETISTIKLLLGLLAVWLYSITPSLDNFEMAFDWFNDSIISKIEVWSFLLLGGLILGISLATYIKVIGETSSYAYNRFVAGFNAGTAIAFSILLLICSYR